MKKILIVVAALLALCAAGAGGWWYAADRGLIPGKPNSPRPENFKAAIDQYLSRTTQPYARPCVHVGYAAPMGRGFPDTRFDWTPTGFRAVLDGRTDGMQGVSGGRFELLAKQGYFESRKIADGTTEYTMTWKGYAASNFQGCFYVATAEREAKIIGYEKKRVENKVDIYEVTARPLPVKVEPWSQTPEFKERFAAGTSYAKQIDPDPVTYELARGDAGFSVLGERGKTAVSRQNSSEDGAVIARLAGTPTPERVKKAAEAYLARVGGTRNHLCLRLPIVPGEADEAEPQHQARVDPSIPVKFAYTFYNIPGRQNHNAEGALRGYELMRRLESLGFATSELLSVAEFKGAPAQGGVRFEIPETVTGKFIVSYPNCYSIGSLQVEEIVHVERFSESTLRPRFAARMALKPLDEDAQRVIGKFGHLGRVAAVGTVMTGTLRYVDGDVQVENAQTHIPIFSPDVSQTVLPAITVTPSRPSTVKPVPPKVGSGIPPSGYILGPGSQAFEVHAIGVYEGVVPGAVREGHPEGTVNVIVHRSSRPVALYLLSYEPVHWVVRVNPGTRMERIVASGYHPQRVTVTGVSGTQVLRVPYVSVRSGAGPTEVGQAASRQFGIPPASSQYTYKGASFEVGAR